MPNRGEVWLVDLGMIAKVRPCLVISIPVDNLNDRVLTTVVPHTTSTRGSRFEVVLNLSNLKPGAFDTQNIITIPASKLIRKITSIDQHQMVLIEQSVQFWLGLDPKD
ncbi:MAG: type II toxin-antitoxin system PemK/MazF family toxin [bacterium]